jgi:hypothetical protein
MPNNSPTPGESNEQFENQKVLKWFAFFLKKCSNFYIRFNFLSRVSY